MRRASTLCFIGNMAMFIAFACCASSMAATWFTGIAQEATLWAYKVRLLVIKQSLSWDVACYGMDVLLRSDFACEAITMLRVCVGTATFMSMVSFMFSVSFLCSQRSRKQEVEPRALMALATWTAVLTFFFAAGGTCLGFYMLQEMPLETPGIGLFAMGFACMMSFLATMMYATMGCKYWCPRSRSDSDYADRDYAPEKQQWPQQQWPQQMQGAQQQQWSSAPPQFPAGGFAAYNQPYGAPPPQQQHQPYGAYPQPQQYGAYPQPQQPARYPSHPGNYPPGAPAMPMPTYGQQYPQPYAYQASI
eukprot:TRINITY_DN22665_c0_g2_i1.p1 TRINITY_DN22665_c0_g2~~TRINITY_DN22665_c0_g2_i1.p1  ORF type:complete len:304 (+),score=54.66 TRINITY_DN22665_c0_g2_i1:58-969(+)